MTKFAESTIEEAAIEWLQKLGYSYTFGPEIAFDGEAPERSDYQETLLHGRLQKAIARINPDIPESAREEAQRRITRLGKPSLLLHSYTGVPLWRQGRHGMAGPFAHVSAVSNGNGEVND